MVAIAIFSIVIAAIYSTWLLLMRSSQVGQRTAAQAQRQRVALRTIEDSLTCIQSFQASMQYYGFVVQNGDQPELSFTARLPDITSNTSFPRNGRFIGFNLRRLTFTLEPGSGSEKNLVLRQNPVLMDMDPDERQTPLDLARDVKKFTIECLDTNTQEWVTEWIKTNSIPTALRISLTFGGNDESGTATPEQAVTRLIAIPSGTLPAGLQGSVGGGSMNGGPPQLPIPTP